MAVIVGSAAYNSVEANEARREISNDDLQIGDIVFIRVTARPFLEVASATRSWTNHVGIVVGIRGSDSLIAESTFPLSRVTTLSTFLARSEHGQFAVARLKRPPDFDQQRRLIEAAMRRMRVLYDTGFNLDSRRQFCSRFVREVIFEATGISIGDVETFETLFRRNPSHRIGFWKYWYLGRLPWQRRTVTPASQFESPDLFIVMDTRRHATGGARFESGREC